MEPTVLSNRKGFSLIEMIIAMVIIMISMLALLTSIVTSMRTNLANEQRNTAVRVMNQTSEALVALKIDDSLISVATHTRVTSDAMQDAKGLPKREQLVRERIQNYDIGWTVSTYTTELKRVVVSVTYSSLTGTKTVSQVFFVNVKPFK